MKTLIIAATLLIHFSKVETKYQYQDSFGIDRSYTCRDTGSVEIKGKYILTDSTLIQRKGNQIKTYWLIKK